VISHLDSFARAIAIALGSSMLVAAALALLVAAFARVMKTSATTRHVLWWIVFSAAALLPLASVAMSFQRVEHHRVQTQPRIVREPRQNTGVRAGAALPVRFEIARLAADTRPAGTRAHAAQPVDWIPAAAGAVRAIARVPGAATALVVLWLAVAALRLGLLVPGLVWLMRVKRTALPLDESIVRRLRRYRHGTRTGRAATICLSADIDVPIAVGLGTPTILLPIRVAETESVADLDQIVMHEHAHLNRYDDVTNLVQRVVERLFWFNPVIAYAGLRISLEREIAPIATRRASGSWSNRRASRLDPSWRRVRCSRPNKSRDASNSSWIPNATLCRASHRRVPSC